MIFRVDHTPGVLQGAVQTALGYEQQKMQLEDREKALAQQAIETDQRQQQIDLAHNSAALAAEEAKQLNDYRQRSLDLDAQQIGNRHKELTAKLLQDPTIRDGLEYAAAQGQDDFLRNLETGSPEWFSAVYKFAEEGQQAAYQKRIGNALGAYMSMEAAGLVPEGTTAQVQAGLAAGADPDTVVQEVLRSLRENGQLRGRKQAITRKVNTARTVLSGDFADTLPEGAAQEIELILGQLEDIAEHLPGSEDLIFGEKDPITGERKGGLYPRLDRLMAPATVQRELAKMEQEAQAQKEEIDRLKREAKTEVQESAARAKVAPHDGSTGAPSRASLGQPKSAREQPAAAQGGAPAMSFTRFAAGRATEEGERIDHTKAYPKLFEEAATALDTEGPAAVDAVLAKYGLEADGMWDTWFEQYYKKVSKAAKGAAREANREDIEAQRAAIEARLSGGQ